jgi:hypothetical protein
MIDEPDDTSSNPQADTHLPVSGEFDAKNIPNNSSPLTSADNDEDASANSTIIDDSDNDDVAGADNRGMTNPS